jgi:hypothetical protein
LGQGSTIVYFMMFFPMRLDESSNVGWVFDFRYIIASSNFNTIL